MKKIDTFDFRYFSTYTRRPIFLFSLKLKVPSLLWKYHHYRLTVSFQFKRKSKSFEKLRLPPQSHISLLGRQLACASLRRQSACASHLSTLTIRRRVWWNSSKHSTRWEIHLSILLDEIIFALFQFITLIQLHFYLHFYTLITLFQFIWHYR